LKVKLLHPDAKLPVRGSTNAIGYGLFTIDNHTLAPQTRVLIPIGIALALPYGTYGRIAPRSSLAAKSNIDISAGVIDPDYRGEIKVLLINNGATSFSIAKGNRVAQLILECADTPDIIQVEDLDDTSRGMGGFGSTGINHIKTRPVVPTSRQQQNKSAGQVIHPVRQRTISLSLYWQQQQYQTSPRWTFSCSGDA